MIKKIIWTVLKQRDFLWLAAIAIGLTIVSLFLDGCAGHKPHDVIVIDNPDQCELACDNLYKLGCDAAHGGAGLDRAFGTEDDETCTDLCRYIIDNRGTLNLECTIEAESCEEVEACFE